VNEASFGAIARYWSELFVTWTRLHTLINERKYDGVSQMDSLRASVVLEESISYVRLEDPIPGPETIGPSLDGPDRGVFQHLVEVRPMLRDPE
jgi:hypothetical protein